MRFIMPREARVFRTALVLGVGLATLLSAARPAFALPFRVAIPELVGPIAFPQIQVQFDFGQEFAHVESVALELVVSATAVEYDYCGTIFDPQPCVHRTVQPGILAILNDPFPGVVFTGLGEGTLSEMPSLQSGEFSAPFSSFDFEWLGSGKGSFDIHWNALGFFPEDLILNFVPRTGRIYEAHILFDAIQVPEPSTALLAASGLALLALAQRRRVPPSLRPSGRSLRRPARARAAGSSDPRC